MKTVKSILLVALVALGLTAAPAPAATLLSNGDSISYQSEFSPSAHTFYDTAERAVTTSTVNTTRSATWRLRAVKGWDCGPEPVYPTVAIESDTYFWQGQITSTDYTDKRFPLYREMTPGVDRTFTIKIDKDDGDCGEGLKLTSVTYHQSLWP